MYEILKIQFESGKALTQNRYYHSVKKEFWPRYYDQLYPLGKEYYHEFNPYFTFNVHSPEFFRFAKTFTVRDGAISFGDFLLKHHQYINKWGTHFIVHRDLAPLIPSNLAPYFSLWQTWQPKKVTPHEAKKIIILGLMCDQYVKDMESITSKLEVLKEVSEDIEIEAYLPLKSNPFEKKSSESFIVHETMNLIRNFLPKKQVKILSTNEILERPNFKGTLAIDLRPDLFLVADNYLDYHMASKGGTVGEMAEKAPPNVIFEVPLSLHHYLTISPLEHVESRFVDLLYYRKKFQVKDILFDPIYHDLVRKLIKVS